MRNLQPDLGVPTWHFKMMNDEDRNHPYREAIKNSIGERAISPRILEVGSGSGLLAMYAAQAGAKEVIALEMNPLIANIATEIVKTNGFENIIKIIPVHSAQFKDTLLGMRAMKDEPFDMLITETIGNAIVNEGIIGAIQDVLPMLKSNATIIPSKLRFHFAPVDMTGNREYFEVGDVDGFDLSAFNKFTPPLLFLESPLETWREFGHAALTMNLVEPALHVTQNFQMIAKKDSVFDGVIVWAELILRQTSVKEISANIRPNYQRNSWNLVYFKTPRQVVERGDVIECKFTPYIDKFWLEWSCNGVKSDVTNYGIKNA